MAFLNRDNHKRSAALQLIRGYDEHNMPVYAYVFGETSCLQDAYEFSQRQLVEISEKATVLHKGQGHKVPKDVENNVMQQLEKLLKKLA